MTAKVVMVAVAAQSALSGSGKLLLVTAPTVVLSFALTIVGALSRSRDD